MDVYTGFPGDRDFGVMTGSTIPVSQIRLMDEWFRRDGGIDLWQLFGLPTFQKSTYLDLSGLLAQEHLYLLDLLQPRKLTHLNLSNSHIRLNSQDEIDSIVRILDEAPLKYLNFSMNPLGPFGAVQLGNYLEYTPHLTHLYVEGGIGMAGVRALMERLYNVPELTHLNLSSNRIGEAWNIMEGLRSVPKLTHLYLYDNKLGPKGVKEVVRGLPHVPKLEYLDLHDNHLGEEGIQTVIQNLHHVPRLTYLHLDSNPVELNPRFMASYILLEISSYPFYDLLVAWMIETEFEKIDVFIFQSLLKNFHTFQ